MSKELFIVGMRRAGTSILRSILMRHSQIDMLEFEPHDLLFAVGTKHIARYRNSRYHKDTIERFKNNRGKYKGAKIVCNPYLSALGWQFLLRYFPNAHYVFIKRDWVDNFNSWYKQDVNSVRGVIPKDMYKYFYDRINKTFEQYYKEHPQNSCILNYEKLVANADEELKKVWKMLKIFEEKGFSGLMKKPSNWRKK